MSKGSDQRRSVHWAGTECRQLSEGTAGVASLNSVRMKNPLNPLGRRYGCATRVQPPVLSSCTKKGMIRGTPT
jgi:hypothetical protein